MLRRSFLQLSAAAIASTRGALPQSAAGTPIRLGFDTYSLRAFKWKALQLLDYAASQRLDTIQISSLDDFESLDPAHLARVRARAQQLGIALDGGIGCICPLSDSWKPTHGSPAEYLRLGMKVAKAIGASSMRCFMGTGQDRTGARPIEALMEETIGIFRSVRSQALDLGVKIALENHAGDMQAREVRTIIEESGKDAVGSCLDTGNPVWAAEDPLVTLEVLGPYVLTTHVRDSAVYEHPRGAAVQWVALGDGVVDFAKFFARYRQLCPQAAVQLEIITGRPPRVLPYLEPDFWKVYPKTPASEFARFAALAKHGHPFSGFMVIEDGIKNPPPEYPAALRAQQRLDLERSLDYAKKTLGLGVNWRS
jgi:sugar phosphate isomerase/epimerase